MPNWLDSLHLGKGAVIVMPEFWLKHYGTEFGLFPSC